MQLILLTRTGARFGARLDLRFHFFLLGFLLVSIAAGLVYAGFSLATSREPRAVPIVRTWEGEMAQQREAVARLRQQAQADLAALTGRLGKLQGHVTRMDALGGKLVKMAKLDADEFDFAKAPPVGGPETGDDLPALGASDLEAAIAALEQRLISRNHQLEVLENLIMDRNLAAEVLPSGRPVKKGWLSSEYGKRTDPFTGKPQYHKGVDFAGTLGREIVAVAGGVVTESRKKTGYGMMVEISHGNGYVTRYAHAQENLVEVGEAVNKGQVIAKMGSSGRSTGPHVHFEVLKNGRHINPNKFIYASR
jgi:murein DD-endopeptidase MepM/ murein hydrolase activator NlpD